MAMNTLLTSSRQAGYGNRKNEFEHAEDKNDRARPTKN